MRKLTTEEFIKRSKNIHGNTYDYSKSVYSCSTEKVTITCRKHGDFEQLPHNHMRGEGCPICTKMENRSIGLDGFIKKAKEIHGEKYDYSKAIFVNTKTKVDIKCPKHGIFKQTPMKHLQGEGCPLCAKNYKDTTESFIKKARLIHGDLYDYSKVEYVDQHTNVCIVDPVYGEFWQQPNSHLNGRGNPARRGEKTYETRKKNGHVNKAEEYIGNMLVSKFGENDVFREYWSSRYPFYCDFYIKSLDLYIEVNLYPFHGKHWFDPTDDKDIEKLREIREKAKTSSYFAKYIDIWTNSDVAKRKIADINNLNYVVFWKNDLSDFKEWYGKFDREPILKQY